MGGNRSGLYLIGSAMGVVWVIRPNSNLKGYDGGWGQGGGRMTLFDSGVESLEGGMKVLLLQLIAN